MHECGAWTQKRTKCKNKVADNVKHCKRHLSSKPSPPKSKGDPKPSPPKSKGTSKSLEKTIADPPAPDRSWPLYSTFWDYYELIEMLGQGNFGALFKIRSNMDGCFYALKVLFGPNFADSKETEALIALSHAPKCRNGIVCYHKKLRVPLKAAANERPSLSKCFVERLKSMSKDKKVELAEKLGNLGDNAHVIMMQYINGPSLDRVELSLDETYELLKSALETLVLIHGRKVVHKDIKPANLMIQEYLTDHGKKQRIVYVDFGISTKFNNEGEVLTSKAGTPRYMCPELLKGSKGNISFYKSADIFALGATFYFLVTKTLPNWVTVKDGYVFDRKKFQKSIKVLDQPSSKKEETLFKVLREMLKLEDRPTALQALANL